MLAAVVAACGRNGETKTTAPTELVTTLVPVPSTGDWPASSPAAEGFDAARLGELAGRIRRGDYGAITSLLIARDGRLLVEEYFLGWQADMPHQMQSVTKSVTSLVAGIAIDRGRLRADDRVIPIFPAYEPIRNRGGGKEALTVRDLLTMRTGLDWSEASYNGSPLQRLNECGCDWLRLVLDWPAREAPGQRWEYNSGGVILLGGAIGVATGARLDRFAADNLFGPLGVRGWTWFSGLPDGLPHAGGGLNLRPRDMLKMGQLVLDEGRWQGQTIVSSAWIRASTARTVPSVRSFGSYGFDYGYLWWMTGADVVAAIGARGQWLFVVPGARLVMAVTGSNDNVGSSPVAFLHAQVLPAMTSSR